MRLSTPNARTRHELWSCSIAFIQSILHLLLRFGRLNNNNNTGTHELTHIDSRPIAVPVSTGALLDSLSFSIDRLYRKTININYNNFEKNENKNTNEKHTRKRANGQ